MAVGLIYLVAGFAVMWLHCYHFILWVCMLVRSCPFDAQLHNQDVTVIQFYYDYECLHSIHNFD